jgi:hypothetical protein
MRCFDGGCVFMVGVAGMDYNPLVSHRRSAAFWRFEKKKL